MYLIVCVISYTYTIKLKFDDIPPENNKNVNSDKGKDKITGPFPVY